MRKLVFSSGLFAILITISTMQLDGQNVSSTKVEFLNAPVLFKEGSKSFQQVVASYTAEKDGKIVITKDGKELLKADLKKGRNRFLLTVPAVTKPKTVPSLQRSMTAPQRNTLLPLFLPKNGRSILSSTPIPTLAIPARNRRSLPNICAISIMPSIIATRPTTCPMMQNSAGHANRHGSPGNISGQGHPHRSKGLRRGSPRDASKWQECIANMAEISDENVMYDFLQPLKEFSKQGIPVKTAMQNDVNGIAWCMPDYFKNTGVKYLIMGINETRSVLPFDKPTAFWWEAPSGERLLAFRADHYMTGNFFGIESSAIKPENMLGHLADIDNKGYPFDRIGIQFSGYFTDNAPPSTAACELVKKWNEKYESPKLRLAVASEFPEYVEKNYSDKLPVFRNAWLDWWTDGYGSTSRETAEVRKNQNTLQTDQGLVCNGFNDGRGAQPDT